MKRSLIWIAVNVVAFGVLAIFHFPSDLPPNGWIGFGWDAVIVGSVFGAVSGTLVGIAQLLTLRRIGHRVRGWWVAASALSISAAHAIGDGFPESFAFPLQVGVGGALLGLTQGVVWGQGATGLRWALAAAAGWMIGLSAGVWVVLTLLENDFLPRFALAAITGLGMGLATSRLVSAKTDTKQNIYAPI